MKTVTLFKKGCAFVCAMLLIISLFAICGFAEETTTEATTETATEAATETATEATTENTATATETNGDNDAENETEAEETGLKTIQIIWIAVGAVVLIAAVVLGIMFRVQIGKFLRVLKSECKKITWLSKDQTLKMSIVVLIVLLICGVVITLLDLGLNKGFLALINLISGS